MYPYSSTTPETKAKTRLGVYYVRESTKDQDKGFSPKNQEDRIKEYAATHNIELVRGYKDLLSGKYADNRDDFQEMIAAAMQKKFDVVLVYHTSRFARNIKEARHYKELLRKKLGIDVLSVTQQFGDWNDPSAFLNEGINELFDEHQSRVISFWVRENLLAKRMQGKEISNPPFGYFKKQIGYDEEKQRPIYRLEWLVHPTESKWVKKMFQLYATGNYSFPDIAKHLNSHGVITKLGNPFSRSSIKDLLKNRSYLGYVTSPRRGLPEIKGKHPPLVSQPVFDQVQDKIKKRRKNIGRPPIQHRVYLLQDLVFCYPCKTRHNKNEGKHHDVLTPKMYCHTHTYKGKEASTYDCKFRKDTGQCKQPSVPCTIIDTQVMEFMEGFHLPADIREMVLEKMKLAFKQTTQSKDKNVKRIAQLEKQKERLNFQFKHTDELTEETYLQELNTINADLARYQGFKPTTNRQAAEAAYLKKTDEFLRDFKKLWSSSLGAAERRAWIQMTIKQVWVQNKKVVAIEPHDDFKALFSLLQKVGGQAPSVTLLHLPFGRRFP